MSDNGTWRDLREAHRRRLETQAAAICAELIHSGRPWDAERVIRMNPLEQRLLARTEAPRGCGGQLELFPPLRLVGAA